MSVALAVVSKCCLSFDVVRPWRLQLRCDISMRSRAILVLWLACAGARVPREAQFAAVCCLMRLFSVGGGARVGRVVAALVAPGVWRCGFVLLVFLFVMPSLQALRA